MPATWLITAGRIRTGVEAALFSSWPCADLTWRPYCFFTTYKKESHTLRKTTQIERRNIEIETFRYFDNNNVENS